MLTVDRMLCNRAASFTVQIVLIPPVVVHAQRVYCHRPPLDGIENLTPPHPSFLSTRWFVRADSVADPGADVMR